MKCHIHPLTLLLPVLFLACWSDTTIQMERRKRHLMMDDGFEGRHSYGGGPECPFPFVDVNGMCLYAFCPSNINYAQTYLQAMATCMSTGLGGNLAIYNSGNEYNNILSYLKQIDPSMNCNYWVGGTNLDENESWRWHTGALVPLGIPFWGNWSAGLYPISTDASANYTILAQDLFWATVNVHDDSQPLFGIPVPLCQHQHPKHHHHHHHHHQHPQHHHPSPGFLFPAFSYIPSFPFSNHHHHHH